MPGSAGVRILPTIFGNPLLPFLDTLITSVISGLNFFGIVVFAISGGLVAARKEMDIFGFALIATVTGLGGGTMRDLLLGSTPVFWIKEPVFLAVTVVAGCLTYGLAKIIESRFRALLWADAVGLALFAITGTEAAMATGVHPLVGAVMGMVTATFGGVIRDVLCNEYPLLLRPEIYASAALTGALVYIALIWAAAGDSVAALAGFAVALLIRGLAIRLSLTLPYYGRRTRRNGEDDGETP